MTLIFDTLERGDAVVQIPALLSSQRNITKFSPQSSNASCGIIFRSNGKVGFQLGGSSYADVGDWLLSGAASSYYLRVTIESGYPDTSTDLTNNASSGTQMNANLVVSRTVTAVNSRHSFTALFEIGNDAGITTVLASRRMTFSCELQQQ